MPIFDLIFDVILEPRAKVELQNDLNDYLTLGIYKAVTAQTGKSLEELEGPIGSREFARCLGEMWSAIYPQLLNLAGRADHVDFGPPTPATITSTIKTKDRMRLAQKAVSTRVLEVLLGLIVICVTVSLFKTRTREILSKNPCSIAAAASLLAGSDMVRDTSTWSDWADGRQQRAKSGLEEPSFSMGWRDHEDGPRFSIDVGESQWSR